MKQPASLIDAQLQHLLSVVERHRDERCTTLLEAARAQAQQLLKRARREARARMHQAIESAREQGRRQLASAQAQHQTQLRMQRQREDLALLARAWQPLHDRLLERWQQNDSRRRWIDALLAQAAATLIDRHWHIEHPADWPESERAALEARLRTELGQAPVFSAREALTAGLRIRAGDAVIDGSAEGLLRARDSIEAMMLAALNDCRRAASDTPQERDTAPSPEAESRP